MPPAVVIAFVNGILTRPSDDRAWTDRMAGSFSRVRWTIPVPYEYWSGPLTRRWTQQRHAAALVEACAAAAAAEHAATGVSVPVLLVGHSNGCDIVDRALALPWPEHVRRAGVALVAAAAEASFTRTAWGSLYMRDTRFRVRIYCSPRDRALRVGGLTRALAPFGLGYGTLGLTGPRDLPPGLSADDPSIEARLSVMRTELGHTWWTNPNDGLPALERDVHGMAQRIWTQHVWAQAAQGRAGS